MGVGVGGVGAAVDLVVLLLFKYDAALTPSRLRCRRLSVVKGGYDLCRVMDVCLEAQYWCFWHSQSQAIISQGSWVGGSTLTHQLLAVG